MKKQQDIAWWYWLVTVLLLALEEAGWKPALYLAMAFCVVQGVHFAQRESNVAALTVQVRIAYLGLLLAGLWEPLHAIHWILLIGTSARVLVDYCFLARSLSLLPWNRLEPLSWGLLYRTFFLVPARATCGMR
jgi:hypothetical protein